MKMNMLKIAGLAVLATAIALAPTQGLAQEKKKEKSETATEKSATPKEGKKKREGLPGRGKVDSVDKTAKTIKLGNRTFHVTDATRITKHGQPAKLDDAVVGENAGVFYREVDGKLMALTLNLGPMPERAPKGEKKSGEQKEKKQKE